MYFVVEFEHMCQIEGWHSHIIQDLFPKFMLGILARTEKNIPKWKEDNNVLYEKLRLWIEQSVKSGWWDVLNPINCSFDTNMMTGIWMKFLAAKVKDV